MTQLCANEGVTGWRGTKPSQQRADIEACAPDDQWQEPPTVKLLDRGSRFTPEKAGIERLVRIDKIDEMMRNALSCGQSRLIRNGISTWQVFDSQLVPSLRRSQMHEQRHS